METNGFWRNRNVFITGCTGLLGSWLTKGLVDNGANVTGLIRDLVPNSNLYRFGLHDRINIVRGELEDYQLLERALNEYEINSVFHIAAQAIVGTANRNPLATFEANIRGTYNLLEACRRNDKLVKRIVVASSDKAYGEHETLPYTENFAMKGKHPYDVSKSCTDLLCTTYAKSYELPVCITRCGNIYGGGDLNFNRIIPGTIKWTLNSEQTVIRSDGKFVRDYIYVEDIVEAYLLLAEKIEPAIFGQAYNFSNEQPISVIELVNEILRMMNRQDLEPVILSQASNEIRNQYLSSEKARKYLDWQPRYSLKDGLTRTIEWYKSFLEEKEI